ncbi:unnamed protein product, partial [Adineta ricciae]
MTSNISSGTTGHAYRLRPMPLNSVTNSSNLTGQSTNSTLNSNSNPLYYGSSSIAAPTVTPPTWSYSTPSQLARKYANIAPIWCHITKPRQLKKKFASTFHQAQSLVSFYNEDRAPSERRGSLTQSQNSSNQSQQQQQQPQPTVHSTSSNPHHPLHHLHHESNSYRQQYTPHYTSHDLGKEPPVSSSTSSSSRAKKKYTGGALTMHISSSRLQSPPPPPPPAPPLSIDEKFTNPSERKARIDQLKDLVFNTRIKDTMFGRTDSKARSTTNLHKANSFKRIDQITHPMDDYQPTVIPPTTPTRKDSHYYHYHLPSNTISSTINDTLNKSVLPSQSSTSAAAVTATSSSSAVASTTSHPSYNYDYLRAKSKEHIRPTYHDSNYITSSLHTSEIPSSSQIGSSNSPYIGSTIATNPLNSYRTFDEPCYIGKPSAVTDKNSSYTAVTSFPSYQTPSSSKRRIKKYLLAKSGIGTSLPHQTEPISNNFEKLSLNDDYKTTSGEGSSVIIANAHAITPPSPRSSISPKSTTITTVAAANIPVIPSLRTTTPTPSSPPIPSIPTLSPVASPPPPSLPAATTSHIAENVVFSTPNAQLSSSPPNNTTNTNTKIPPVIGVSLSSSLTSLNKQHQPSLKSTTNSLLELVPSHSIKEQSPSRSIISTTTEDGSSTPARNNLQTSSSIERHRRRRHNRHDSSENRHGVNNATGTARAESISSNNSTSKRSKKTNNLTNNHTNNNYQHHHHKKRSTSTPNQR